MTDFNQPISGNDLARFSGPNTFMRLPQATSLDGLDVAILGVPMDIGTSWRSGTRFGPKQIRAESAMIRPYNMTSGAAPFDSLNIGDIGDLAINTFSLPDSLRIIQESYSAILSSDVTPVAMGGDHSITLPILRAIAEKYGPVALVHVDAHADVNDDMFGERETHGTVFRRAYEEGLIVADKTYQIGLRGTGYGADDFKEAQRWGFQHFPASELWNRSLHGMGAEIRRDIGNRPVYVSYDIDSLDPAYAPGTGTPEIGGLTTPQALELIRALRGLNIVGCDMVEVSPPYDTSGNTALTAANLLYELLCVLPGVTTK
ncbi:agmatinase [Phaeobacter gallaeciensis]|uniref:Agmatinase SpeB n=1 Tax=Phaeobacter gallaeciensis TaxID=60890 RepID=A0AAD0ECJ0_9RHOB|nr:agmatinase [Phaeobacter gallaeciensis]AHD09200.1 agmatinase [Phaeobacter gallaeciensis DSM 26640]ATE92463.1 agmatinase SpeB [Phaeobacter gallaeciensis]ATE97715.1 agmatinase SpeB [Phaeobacter gallaeciensis]ATF01128.1 agmatinase SpeB [Phaeobacter gallaeciensis]ATF05508.1 agmatinase SpeB [Phaeobacter gallaeciensis]